MNTADTTQNEEHRLAALHRYDVLDTPPEESIDRITRLAKATMGAPIAYISLIDGHRQWLKSRQGEIDPVTRREDSFCTLTITQSQPLIVEDATKDERFAANALVAGEAGARFYVGVPLRTPDGHNIGALCALDHEPRTATVEQINLMQDLARLVIDQFELRRLARFDTLTGALTRRAFRSEAEREFDRARRHDLALSLMVFDLDYFKMINDAYGHPVGDHVLTTISEFTREQLRSADLFTRLGGEEFAILLPDTDLTAAGEAAERLRRVFAARSTSHGDTTIRATASFGVTTLTWNDRTIDHLLKRADRALYDAKTSGRDRVIVTPAERTALPLAG